MNLIENIKGTLSGVIGQALNNAVSTGMLPVGGNDTEIFIETPKDKSHGDFSCNIAMLLSKTLKMPPRNIAEQITAQITDMINENSEQTRHIDKTEVAGAGFINFYLKNDWLYELFDVIDNEGENYGRIDLGKGKSVMVEFVSANPTGPMHMGNARGGALGDCLASVLEYAGYKVSREFYINDAGNQIEKFGLSLEARYMQELLGEDTFEFPEDGYHGDDIREGARNFIEINGDKYLNAESSERRAALVDYALEKNIEALKSDLERYRITFDVWFRESELHKSGEVMKTVQQLKDKGFAYDKDGAVWLNAEKMGMEKDEVLVRQNGIPTYFAADIAYHRNKLETRGFDFAIDIWGADHHGHVARMKSAMEAVGINSDRLTVVLMQLVRLMQDGQVVRMSKRTGKAVTLSDLLEDINVDVARFFFNMRGAGSHLDFDLNLAKDTSNENPVYYVQYAHARICSIIWQLKEEGIHVPAVDRMDASVLVCEEEIDLLRKLCELPDEIKNSAIALEPARMTRYVTELAGVFHGFYNGCRVKADDEKLMLVRLKLIDCVRLVIKNVLTMLKIDAPESM